MAMVSFKRGSDLSKLPINDGQLILHTTERALYTDVGTERIRIGDFIQVDSIANLPAASSANTTAFYYAVSENILAKSDGASWTQINKSMTSVVVEGDGNAVTSASYNKETGVLTLTKGATYMTAADVDAKDEAVKAEVMDYVGDIPEGYTEETVIAYINKKAEETLNAASGGSSESAASVLAALNTYKSENDPKVEANTAAAAAAQSAAEAAQATADSKVTMAEVEAKDYATKAEAKGYADAKDEAIAAAKAAADAAQADVDALELVVGTPAEGKTIVEMIADAQTAATYDDTEVKANIAENAEKIAAIEADYLKAADKTELSNAIQAEADRAAAAEKVNADAIAAVKEDVDAFLNAAEVGEAAVDTLKEIQTYIESDGAAADTMTKNIADNKAAIEAEVERAEGAEAALSGRLDALEAIDHEHANMDVLNGITAEKVSAWDGAQAAAEATAAAALASAKSELEGKITAEADRAKGIEAGLETRLAAVEADYLKTADKEELAGDIADVDAKFANYSTTEQMNAAIKVVDDKFANYSTTEQMNAAIKVEADRAAAAEEALSGRLDTLEAIDHEAYVAADEKVLADAKAHAEGLISWGEF